MTRILGHKAVLVMRSGALPDPVRPVMKICHFAFVAVEAGPQVSPKRLPVTDARERNGERALGHPLRRPSTSPPRRRLSLPALHALQPVLISASGAHPAW